MLACIIAKKPTFVVMLLLLGMGMHAALDDCHNRRTVRIYDAGVRILCNVCPLAVSALAAVPSGRS